MFLPFLGGVNDVTIGPNPDRRDETGHVSGGRYQRCYLSLF